MRPLNRRSLDARARTSARWSARTMASLPLRTSDAPHRTISTPSRRSLRSRSRSCARTSARRSASAPARSSAASRYLTRPSASPATPAGHQVSTRATNSPLDVETLTCHVGDGTPLTWNAQADHDSSGDSRRASIRSATTRARTIPGQPRWRFSAAPRSDADRACRRRAASAMANASYGRNDLRQSATVRARVVTGTPCGSVVTSSSEHGATSTCMSSRCRVGPSDAVTLNGGQPPTGLGRRHSRAAWAWLTTTSRSSARTVATACASRGSRPDGARTPRRTATSLPRRRWTSI